MVKGGSWLLIMDRKKGEVLCPMDVLMEDIQMVTMRENDTREGENTSKQLNFILFGKVWPEEDDNLTAILLTCIAITLTGFCQRDVIVNSS